MILDYSLLSIKHIECAFTLCLHQELEPNSKEPVFESVPECISKTGTDIGTYITFSIESVLEPELYKIIN